MIELVCAPPGEPASRVQIGVDRNAIVAAIDAQPSFVVADARVLALHPLPQRGGVLPIDGGEHCKSPAWLERVLRAALQHGVDRSVTLVALGGGSVGDLGGLAASLLLRGVRFVQVPTTLLAMLDSSVGGKTAINLPEGKNLVGTFWPAALVLVHTGYLATLPDPEYRSGLGEALKVGIGLSAELFELLESGRDALLQRDPALLDRVVELAVRAKIRVVEADPRENGQRRLLNLGHTLGHALEAHAGGRLPHGIAVARGIAFALDLARARGDIDTAAAERCDRLLDAYGFERTPLPPASALAPFLRRDKKSEGDRLHMVLPTGIGTSTTSLIDVAAITARLA